MHRAGSHKMHVRRLQVEAVDRATLFGHEVTYRGGALDGPAGFARPRELVKLVAVADCLDKGAGTERHVEQRAFAGARQRLDCAGLDETRLRGAQDIEAIGDGMVVEDGAQQAHQRFGEQEAGHGGLCGAQLR